MTAQLSNPLHAATRDGWMLTRTAWMLAGPAIMLVATYAALPEAGPSELSTAAPVSAVATPPRAVMTQPQADASPRIRTVPPPSALVEPSRTPSIPAAVVPTPRASEKAQRLPALAVTANRKDTSPVPTPNPKPAPIVASRLTPNPSPTATPVPPGKLDPTSISYARNGQSYVVTATFTNKSAAPIAAFRFTVSWLDGGHPRGGEFGTIAPHGQVLIEPGKTYRWSTTIQSTAVTGPLTAAVLHSTTLDAQEWSPPSGTAALTEPPPTSKTATVGTSKLTANPSPTATPAPAGQLVATSISHTRRDQSYVVSAVFTNSSSVPISAFQFEVTWLNGGHPSGGEFGVIAPPGHVLIDPGKTYRWSTTIGSTAVTGPLTATVLHSSMPDGQRWLPAPGTPQLAVAPLTSKLTANPSPLATPAPAGQLVATSIAHTRKDQSYVVSATFTNSSSVPISAFQFEVSWLDGGHPRGGEFGFIAAPGHVLIEPGKTYRWSTTIGSTAVTGPLTATVLRSTMPDGQQWFSSPGTPALTVK